MDSRTRFALSLGGLLALAVAAAAQNPPPATPAPIRLDTVRPDTLAPRLLYDETFAPGSNFVPRVTLEAGTVYRIETEPGQPVSVSYSRRPAAQPLFLVPLSGGGPEASGSAAFLVVPQSTDEYRIDIQWTQTEPVRLTIWTDPKEMSRWARMRASTAGLPTAGLSVRAVYLGGFVRPAWRSWVSQTTPRGLASAYGLEACVAVLPRGGWFSGPWGGCALALARLTRPDSAGGLWRLSIEPRYELSRPGAVVQQSVALTLGIATTVGLPGSAANTDYVGIGLGYQVATRALGRHLYVEADAGLTRMQQLGPGIEPLGRASVVPDLAAGLQYRF
jgi:hypothetical protein